MRFAIISESTHKEITQEVLVKWASAIVTQVARDYCPSWEASPSEVSIISDLSMAGDAAVLHLVDSIPEAPGALAYHTTTPSGRPELRLGVQTILDAGGTLSSGPDSVTCALSHEVLETIADPYCSTWNDFDGTKLVAFEVCDPVQGDSYEIDNIAVSNFVTPRWFDQPGSPGPFDHLEVVKAPREVAAGGYLAFNDGTQVFGEHVSAFSRALRQKRFGRRSAK